mgnify:CR=1 FL=1
MFGPFIGAIPSLLLVVIQSPLHALYLLIFIIVLQQVDGNIIGPKILGDSTGLSAFWVMFSILIGGGLFGFLGMLLGVPVFAMIYYIIRRLVNHSIRKKNLTTVTEAYVEAAGVDEATGAIIYYGEKQKKKRNKVVISVLFAISGLICWCGISQVISNSVVSSFKNAFSIPPIYMTVVLVAVAAVIVLRKDATVKILDMVVPVMAVCYFAITILIIVTNLGSLPGVFARIFEEAFGFRQAAAGGFGAVLMNGIKRGLFSNEAGSGSAPCAAAAAECDQPVKAGLVQALGVFVDTIVICSCTAFIMLLAPEEKVTGLSGMDLLQTAMEHHLGRFGVIFIAATLFLFSFSTFLGILFYARCNVAYLFGDNWASQTAYKVLALVMLFIGGLAAYTFVWDLGDVGIGMMTIFNIIILYPQGEKALKELKEYEKEKRK